MKKPRVQDIAKNAGVSAATVTRVLRGNGYASEETKEQVLQVAQELGYDFARQNEKNGVPQVIIFSLHDEKDKNRFFSDVQELLCCEIQKLGWYCITHYIKGARYEEIRGIIEETRGLNLKGIIFNCMEFMDDLSSFRKYFATLPMPTVMIERFPNLFGVNKIMINAKEAVFLAVDYLYRKGHRNIAFVAPDYANEVEHSHIDGFENAVSVLGLEEAHYLPVQEYNQECGERAMKKYVEMYGSLPTAVICADPIMVGVYSYLYKQNFRIPEDISLVGLDDSIACVMTPALTSVAFPTLEVVNNAVQILTEESQLTKTVRLSTHLIERDTVAPPKKV